MAARQEHREAMKRLCERVFTGMSPQAKRQFLRNNGINEEEIAGTMTPIEVVQAPINNAREDGFNTPRGEEEQARVEGAHEEVAADDTDEAITQWIEDVWNRSEGNKDWKKAQDVMRALPDYPHLIEQADEQHDFLPSIQVEVDGNRARFLRDRDLMSDWDYKNIYMRTFPGGDEVEQKEFLDLGGKTRASLTKILIKSKLAEAEKDWLRSIDKKDTKNMMSLICMVLLDIRNFFSEDHRLKVERSMTRSGVTYKVLLKKILKQIFTIDRLLVLTAFEDLGF
ncbi:unnamed protein product [Amoebophrya sp. A25]|nr:unnamed protein product [Amoebophrya sp. A25]|eukprot:GSA25T00020501001.1